jgi:sulfur carrier protein
MHRVAKTSGKAPSRRRARHILPLASDAAFRVTPPIMCSSIHITVNGEATTLQGGHTVADLLAHVGLAEAPCAVEVNRDLVPKRKHASHTLRDGDVVEIVTLVGGG